MLEADRRGPWPLSDTATAANTCPPFPGCWAPQAFEGRVRGDGGGRFALMRHARYSRRIELRICPRRSGGARRDRGPSPPGPYSVGARAWGHGQARCGDDRFGCVDQAPASRMLARPFDRAFQ